MAFLGVGFAALEISANLNVTSEHLLDYKYDHGSQRLVLEVAAVILWIVFFALDMVDVVRYAPFFFHAVPIAVPIGMLYACFMHNYNCHAH